MKRAALLIAFLICTPAPAEPRPSIAIFAGPGAKALLVDIVRLRDPILDPRFSVGAAYAQPLWSPSKAFRIEVEVALSKMSERADLYAFAVVPLIRWFDTPWSRVAPGSVAIGDGISYATGIPELEQELTGRSSRLLNALLFEVAFDVGGEGAWQALLRLNHRSGIFGLVDGVVGGSDYFCLGVRRSL